MKTILIFSLLFGVSSFAQTPVKDFLEISPEQEKKIQESERKKAEFIKRKHAEEKKKQELAKLAEKQKREEQNKREEEARIASQKKAEERKKQEEDRKKKEETEAYTKWLISERDRKMRKASSPVEKPTANPSVNTAKSNNSGKAIQESPEDMVSPPVSVISKSARSRSCKGTGPDEAAFDRLHKEVFRTSNGKLRGGITKYPCYCWFQKPLDLPEDLKVLAIATYEGTIPGKMRGFREHPMNDVTINVNSSGPVALMMWTYEPINWIIKKNGADVRAIFVMGYHSQKVQVEGDVPVLISSHMDGDRCHYSGSVMFEDEGEVRARKRLEQFSQYFFARPLNKFEYKPILAIEEGL